MGATLLKKRLWYRCFLINFAKFLRIPFLTEHLCWLLVGGITQGTKNGLNLHIPYLIKSIIETISKWSMRNVNWNISWTYQIFWEFKAVKSPAKSQNLLYIYLVRYIHAFYCKSILKYWDCKNNIQLTKIYGKKARVDQAQIQTRTRVKITFYLHRKIYSSFLKWKQPRIWRL